MVESVWREVRVSVSDSGELVVDANGRLSVLRARQAAPFVNILRAAFEENTVEPKESAQGGRRRNDNRPARSRAFYYRAVGNWLAKHGDRPFNVVELARDNGGWDHGFSTFVYRARLEGSLARVEGSKRPVSYRVTKVGLGEIARYQHSDEE